MEAASRWSVKRSQPASTQAVNTSCDARQLVLTRRMRAAGQQPPYAEMPGA
jgi:hypothetical protein